MFEIAHFEFISTFGGYIPEERVITIVILSKGNDVQKVYFRFASYGTSPNWSSKRERHGQTGGLGQV